MSHLSKRGVSVSFMEFNWLQAGYELARLVVFTVVGLVSGVLLFREYVAPGINQAIEQLDKADETITNLAKLAGVKSQEYTASKGIEKAVAEDFIKQKIPELELVKTFVSPATWVEIQDTIENNPEAVIQLWEKYGHFFTQGEEKQDTEFDF